MAEIDKAVLMSLEPSHNLETTLENGNDGNDFPRMSPVQIQQEYYENLPDCDWIKYVNFKTFYSS